MSRGIAASTKGADRTCGECGAAFKGSDTRKFCSHACAWRSNERSPECQWLFGRSNGYHQARRELNPGWKGDEATYRSLHSWVARNFGTPRVCEHCGTTTAAIYDWSSKDGQFSRDREDWQRLCRSCHMKYDYAHGMRTQTRGKRGPQRNPRRA